MIEVKNRYLERIKRFKDEVLGTRSTICTQRAEAYTRIYRTREADPIIIRRALALEETLKTMTIFINPDELIVGNQACRNRAAPIFPEYAVEFIINELDEFEKRSGDAFYPDAETKKTLAEVCKWWEGRTTLDKGRALMSPDLREIHKTGIIRAEGNLTSGDAHLAINHRKLLEIGLDGYLAEVEKNRKNLHIAEYADLKKEQFYRSVEISLRAFSDFIMRYAVLAEATAAGEEREERRKELSIIAENCRRIAHDPPEDFYQALQFTYFSQLVLQIESNGHSLSLGRMDQYLYPFYKKDMEKGILTGDRVMLLLEYTWIKLYSILKIRSWSHTRYSVGSPLYQNVTIGGQTRDGKDAVNDLSYLILWSVGECRMTQPNLSVRYHDGMSREFLKECVKVIEKGFGMPAFNNDEIVIPSFIELGVEKEDAYDYSAIGCIEVAVPGKWGYRCTGKHFINFMRVFLAVLNNGKDTMSGRTFLPGKGTLADFPDFKSLMDEWERQIVWYAESGVAIDTAVDTVLEEEAPDVLCSAFTDDCIGRGLTIHQGGAVYEFVSGLQVGIANLGNSLAAIKKYVYEEKTISPEDLMAALENDFSGDHGEALRQMLMEAPKFGNDDDYVDEILTEAYLKYIDKIETCKTIRYGRGPVGGFYYAGTSSISANVPSGAVVPATPDGRKAWSPLAEGCSPSSGTDIKGPTAVFNSIAKLPTSRILGGVLLNQKLSPAVIREEEDKDKLVSLLRVFFSRLKGWHVQYNIVDREILLAAQEKPEEYRDLVVRVAGYSAFFTVLSPEAQNDIIARTEHSL